MMKKMHLFVAATLVLSVAWAFTAPAGTPEPKEGVLIGEVVDIAGYGMFGRLGKENSEAGQYHSSHGFPVGILEEETGDLWIALYRLPVPAAGVQTANAILTPHMGTMVVVQGVQYRRPGLNLIRLSLVSEY